MENNITYPYIIATISPELPTWEYLYHDWNHRENKEFKIFINNRAFKTEVKLHGLEIVHRRLEINDELKIWYAINKK